jgi:catechol 2,3-dioxygenase-like lactoylglutathione lyase family enzyme
MLKSQAAFCGLSVNDLDKAKDFYTQVLGLVLENEKMGLHLKLPGGGSLFIYDKGAGHQPATFTVLNFVVVDIDEAVGGLTGSGVSFVRYEDMPGMQDEKGILRSSGANPGPSIAWFKDPSGNIISLLQEQ